jgi:hypothetical protein
VATTVAVLGIEGRLSSVLLLLIIDPSHSTHPSPGFCEHSIIVPIGKEDPSYLFITFVKPFIYIVF